MRRPSVLRSKTLKWTGSARPFESPAGVPGRRRRMGCGGNIDGVMDGDLDGFLNAYLTQLATGELKK